MHALTVCQPYASLIAAGVKRVENRSTPFLRRVVGCEIAIHAGLSRAWFSEASWGLVRQVPQAPQREGEFPYGAVLAVAKVVAVAAPEIVLRRMPDQSAHVGGITIDLIEEMPDLVDDFGLRQRADEVVASTAESTSDRAARLRRAADDSPFAIGRVAVQDRLGDGALVVEDELGDVLRRVVDTLDVIPHWRAPPCLRP